jgi:hypothetical protein
MFIIVFQNHGTECERIRKVGGPFESESSAASKLRAMGYIFNAFWAAWSTTLDEIVYAEIHPLEDPA